MYRPVLRLAPLLGLLALAGCRSAFAPPSVARIGNAPSPAVAASVSRETTLLSGPHARANALETLQAGAEVTASDEVVRGFRRVRTAEGKTGYVAQEAVALGAAAPAQAQTAAEPAAPTAPAQPAAEAGAPDAGQ